MRRRLPSSTLFPYTTLFRSQVLTTAYSGVTVVVKPTLLTVSGTVPVLETVTVCTALEVPMSCRAKVSAVGKRRTRRSEEHTSELQSRFDVVCRRRLENTNLQ